MRATQRHPASGSNEGSTTAAPNGRQRWGTSGKVDPVCVGVARRLGIAPKTAEHRLRELPREVVACIDEFYAQGAELRGARFTRLIRAALERRAAPPLCDAMFTRSQQADSAEEVAETAFNRHGSDANLDWLIRTSEDEQRHGEARLLALYVERDRRRGRA